MSKDEHQVGYGRPPKKHQWKPGSPSPNPNGRPSRKALDIAEMLNAPLSVSVGGETKAMSPLEAGLWSSVSQAIKGNMRAAKRFLTQCEQAGLINVTEQPEESWPEIVVPQDWDPGEWLENYYKYGPPPWEGERDGLVHDNNG